MVLKLSESKNHIPIDTDHVIPCKAHRQKPDRMKALKFLKNCPFPWPVPVSIWRQRTEGVEINRDAGLSLISISVGPASNHV